jgi:hypothetical protein
MLSAPLSVPGNELCNVKESISPAPANIRLILAYYTRAFRREVPKIGTHMGIQRLAFPTSAATLALTRSTLFKQAL